MADGKLCIICGTDCTTLPRIKNSKGQYACRACVDAKRAGSDQPTNKPATQPALEPANKPKANTPPPRAASASGAALMEQWAARSVEGKIAMGMVERPKCPKCDYSMMPDSVICLGCGFNNQSGRKVSTRIQKADKDPSSGGGISLDGGNALIIAGFIAAVGLTAGSALAGEAGVLFVVLAGLWGLGGWIMMIVAAFQDGDQKWGIFGLCTLVPCLGLPLALAFIFYYCTVGSTRTSWKANYWLSTIAWIGTQTALAISNPEIFAATP